MPERNLRPLYAIRQNSQWNQDKGQEQKGYENIVQGRRRAAGEKTWRFAGLNGKGGENQNKEPAKECQQEERPAYQHQPYPHWSLKEDWQAADPS
jgi:hypothetical protein